MTTEKRRKGKRETIDLSFLDAVQSGQETGIFAASVSGEQPSQMLALALLDDNPYQPRLEIAEAELEGLTADIRSLGFQGALVARHHPQQHGRYQIAAGHRRREAALRAGRSTVPVLVRELTDLQMALVAATENLHRKDLNVLEQGRACLYLKQTFGLKQEEIALALKKGRGWITNRLRLAQSDPDIQQLVLRRPKSIRAVSYLIQVKDQDRRAPIIQGLLQGRITVDDVPLYIASGAGSSPSQDEMRAREGLSKLKRARSTLGDYRAALAARAQPPTSEEVDELACIATLLETLRAGLA